MCYSSYVGDDNYADDFDFVDDFDYDDIADFIVDYDDDYYDELVYHNKPLNNFGRSVSVKNNIVNLIKNDNYRHNI